MQRAEGFRYFVPALTPAPRLLAFNGNSKPQPLRAAARRQRKPFDGENLCCCLVDVICSSTCMCGVAG